MTDKLEKTGSDHALTVVRVLGSVGGPIGTAIAEIVGSVVPGQRLDRLVAFVREISREVDALKIDMTMVQERLSSESGALLAEKAVMLAVGPETSTKRQILARMLARGLSDTEFDADRLRLFVRMLEQLSDAEVVVLVYHSLDDQERERQFLERHANVLEPVEAGAGSSVQETDRMVLQESYAQHLAGLGLLQRNRGGYEVTWLGRMLVRYVDESPFEGDAG